VAKKDACFLTLWDHSLRLRIDGLWTDRSVFHFRQRPKATGYDDVNGVFSRAYIFCGFWGFLFEVFGRGGKIDQRCNKGLRDEQGLWTAFD
jgi:hypothetical protein